MKLDTDANIQRRLSLNVTLVILLLPPTSPGSPGCILHLHDILQQIKASGRPGKVDNEIVYRSAGARSIQSKCGVSPSERFKQVSEGW